METKVCAKCKRELPLDKFGKNSGRKDGKQDWCKECVNSYMRERYVPKSSQKPSPSKSGVLYLADVATLLYSSPELIMHKFRSGEFPFDNVDNQGRIYWEIETIQNYILKRIEERKSA